MSIMRLSNFRGLRSCGNEEKRLVKAGRDARTSEFKISVTSADHTKGCSNTLPLFCSLRGGFTGVKQLIFEVLSTLYYSLLGGGGKRVELQYSCCLFVKSDKGVT